MSTTTQSELTEKLLGTWKLISWHYEDNDGNKTDFFGPMPTGRLTYTNDGYMSAHLVQSGRPQLSQEGMFDGTPEEMIAAYKSYFGYYGKFYEEEPGTIVHEVEGCILANWVGQKQRRFVKLENGNLVIYTPPILSNGKELVFYLVWER